MSEKKEDSGWWILKWGFIIAIIIGALQALGA
jgi:hypothetical protein